MPILRPLLRVHHPFCFWLRHRSVSISTSWSQRLPSSEIPTAESTASCTAITSNSTSAFQQQQQQQQQQQRRPVDAAFPIGSLSPAGSSINIQPRSDSPGTIKHADAGGGGDDDRAGVNGEGSGGGTVDRGPGAERQNGKPTTAAARPFDQGRRSTSAPKTGIDEDFVPSSTVVLRGVGTAVLEADIRRLFPRKIHIPELRDDTGLLRVIPSRDPQSLDRRPGYHIIFAQPWMATKFADSMTSIFSKPSRAEWPDAGFPPGSWPVFATLDVRDSSLAEQEQVLQRVLNTGGAAAGQCVLLTICGVGGRTVASGRLPRTHDVRAILEESDVELCRADVGEGGPGIQRLIQTKFTKSGDRVIVKADGRGLGAEGRWLVRCASKSEAHRVVRELHMRAPWDGGGTFRAEVIY